MKLYYSPGACSIGIHVVLEEIGRPYELHRLNFAAGEQHAPEFKAINPKSKVPTLVRDDGSVLTEFPAIAAWLARSSPDSRLLPEDVEGQTRALEAMDYIVATVHMQGFSRIFRPGNFSPNEADHDKVKARGHEIFLGGLEVMNKRLDGNEYVVGPYSVADAALFYVEFWGAARLKLDLPANCAAHYKRMTDRPAVKKVLEKEGFGAG